LENEQVKPSYSRSSLLKKYFMHGLVFSLLLLVLVIVWAFLVAFLVAIGFIVGLIIGFILLFFVVGGLNAVLTQSIWEVYEKQDWKSLLGHGIVLFIALILVHAPFLVVLYLYPSLIAEVFLFLVYCFIDGYVARHVGFAFEEERYDV
jgi:hypothetical protein